MAPQTSIADFRRLVAASDRILAVLGAGLSAASGLPTFRGAGGLWRNYEPTALATPEAFAADPALVWLFYAWRKHMALKAAPNAGHYALAALARKKPNFLCLTQNVDGLSPRAGHPASSLRPLHGSLLDVKCSNERCGYIEHDNLADPPFPALAPACDDDDHHSHSSSHHPPPGQTTTTTMTLPPLLDPSVPVPEIPLEQIPRCPACGGAGLLRPGVVWFGEHLDEGLLAEVDGWIRRAPVDLVLVVGTSSAVYPAAGYADQARDAGAVVAVVNPDPAAAVDLADGDFFFRGPAAEMLPLLFEDVIGKMDAGGGVVRAGEEA